MKGTVELKTDRLTLRRVRMEDAETLHIALGCDKEITKYTGWNPYFDLNAAKEKISEDIEGYNKIGCYSWIIQLEDKIVGTVGAYDYDESNAGIEIGYSIFRAYWGQGIAKEAVQAVVKHLLESEKVSRISAWCHADNIASQRVLENAGFVREKKLENGITNQDGTVSDKIIYAKSRKIREMKASDWQRVAEIYTQGIEKGTATFNTICPTYEEWDESHIKSCRLVYEHNGEVVGWTALSPTTSREAYRGVVEVSIYVDLSYGGQGIGTALLTELSDECEKHGFWSLYSAVFAINTASIRLHKKCGFREIGYRERIARDRFGQWQNTIMMEKRLNDTL